MSENKECLTIVWQVIQADTVMKHQDHEHLKNAIDIVKSKRLQLEDALQNSKNISYFNKIAQKLLSDLLEKLGKTNPKDIEFIIQKYVKLELLMNQALNDAMMKNINQQFEKREIVIQNLQQVIDD